MFTGLGTHPRGERPPLRNRLGLGTYPREDCRPSEERLGLGHETEPAEEHRGMSLHFHQTTAHRSPLKRILLALLFWKIHQFCLWRGHGKISGGEMELGVPKVYRCVRWKGDGTLSEGGVAGVLPSPPTIWVKTCSASMTSLESCLSFCDGVSFHIMDGDLITNPSSFYLCRCCLSGNRFCVAY